MNISAHLQPQSVAVPQRRRVLVPVAVGTIIAFAAAGCSIDVPSAGSTDTSATTEATCATMVHDAAFAAEVEQQIELLDTALVECSTVDELTAEIDKYPRFSGYPTAYLITNRCENTDADQVRNSDVCLVAAPTTTQPPVQANDIVYIGETLDGRQVELRPSPELPFIDDAPAEIKRTVDVAIAEGCDGVISRRDYWYIAFEGSGDDAASVFVQHAINVAKLLNCGDRPFPTSEPSSSDSSSSSSSG